MYTTLSPCTMCSGACILYGIPRIVMGENETFVGEFLRAILNRSLFALESNTFHVDRRREYLEGPWRRSCELELGLL